MKATKDSRKLACNSYDVWTYAWARDSVGVDYTGAVMEAVFRPSVDSDEILFTLSKEAGTIVPVGSDGQFNLILHPAMSAAIDNGKERKAIGHVNIALAGEEAVRLLEIKLVLTPSTIKND